MMLRAFQSRACKSVIELFESVRSVCLVAPTGSGKTVMGAAIVRYYYRRNKRVLFVAHRRELIRQSKQKLSMATCPFDIGTIMAGDIPSPQCQVQVASIQTLLAQGFPDEIELLVTDECHHYNADDWNKVITHYPDAKLLGLTATPVRADGRALGDVFEELVVAAQAPELIRDGYLVPCRVIQPERGMGSNEVAKDPLLAYQQISPGKRCFGFASRVQQCDDLAARFTAAGYPSRVIEAKTPATERDANLSAFRSGEVKVLWNVYALTEGVDVPEAEVCMIGRKVENIGMFLQMCGRVLRPSEGKTEAIIIDLNGATLKHGFPTEAFEFSLDGNAIKRTSVEPLRVCPSCGVTSPAWQAKCPACGFVPSKTEAPCLKIFDHNLREVFQDAGSSDEFKKQEYARMRSMALSKGLDPHFVIREYAKRFGESIVIHDATEEEKRVHLEKLRKKAIDNGWKSSWASVRYKQVFGEWP